MVATAVYSVVERSRISSLQSHGKALEKECSLPGVFCDSGDTPANLLCELNGYLMPCTSCLYGKWVEDVCTGQFGQFIIIIIVLLTVCNVTAMISTSAEGIPQVYYSESCHRHTALVMELLGPSLESLFNKCHRKFTFKTTTMIAIQLVSLPFTVSADCSHCLATYSG